MKSSDTIAIVGQGCVFPNCFSPEQLWKNIVEGRVSISPAKGKWRIDENRIVLGSKDKYIADTAFTSMGGYVRGFQSVFSPQNYQIESSLLRQLDPVFQWSLYAGEEACRFVAPKRKKRAGVILGNLCYPTAMYADLYEKEILSQIKGQKAQDKAKDKAQDKADSYNRFNAGLPAHFVAKGLGLSGGDTFALNAACASGIYAIKLACDALLRGEVDLMLAGAVNAPDFVILNVGFSALKALSPTGQSRPFHLSADGLVPAEGAGIISLQRLEDALADSCPILGLIRGVGLSNDGQQGGFLVPSKEGQVRCMESAFQQCDLDPQDVSLIECHATGTVTGDAKEIESMAQVFSQKDKLTVGSIKSQFGHLLAASSMASLMKILGAFKHQIMPHTPNAFPTIPQVEKAGFQVLNENKSWETNSLPRLACVNSFGFGGNNGHLILEEWTGIRPKVKVRKPALKVVATAVEVCTHLTETTDEFLSWMIHPSSVKTRDLPGISLPAKLKFPPKDLEQALGQQLLILKATCRALENVSLPSKRTGVFIGCNIDADSCRYGLRWRLADLLSDLFSDQAIDQDWLKKAQDEITPPFEAANVIGTMANIPANRVNTQFDCYGPGFTIFAEELSGDKALEVAVEAIRAGEIDCAVVGAVDLCREPLHEKAWKSLGNNDFPPADAAVAIILKSSQEAEKCHDKVMVVWENSEAGTKMSLKEEDFSFSSLGHSHATSGLLKKAFAILLAEKGYTLVQGKPTPLLPGKSLPTIAVTTKSFTEERSTVEFKPVRNASEGKSPVLPPYLYTYRALDKESLLQAVLENRLSRHDDLGQNRLAFIAYPSTFAQMKERAVEFLQTGKNSKPQDIIYRDKEVKGDLAFVFTGAAAAYPEMGRDLLLGYPELLGYTARQVKDIEKYASWVYSGSTDGDLPFYQLSGSSFLCQVHAQFTQNLLGISPDAVMGLSSGETNSMFALGVWKDMDGLLQDVEQSELYTQHLAENFTSVHEYWGLSSSQSVHWENWRIRASVEDVRKSIAGEKVYLSIIYTDQDCVMGGDKEACRKIIEANNYQALPIDHNLAIHCPVVAPFSEKWRKIHTRTCYDVPSIKFYSNYFGKSYQTNTENVSEALTGQALQTIDFPKIIRQAWEDGVRIFIEHGPRNSLSLAIKEILPKEDYLTVSLDVPGKSSLKQGFEVAAKLWCAGVTLDIDKLNQKKETPLSEKKERLYQWRRPPIQFPQLPLVSESTSGVGESIREELIEVMHTEGSQVYCEYLQYQEQGMQAYHKFLATMQEQLGQNSFALSSLPLSLSPRETFEEKSANSSNPIQTPISSDTSFSLSFPGPKFSREELEILSQGKISSIFGREFEFQDQYLVQVRMPEPPLLLCDRVLGIEGVPLSMGTGTIWTETDVHHDSWYLHQGRMPAGIFIESGQADLLLISWLGIDEHNRGERAYRLLGCELVFHDSMPQPGDTLHYKIDVVGHARSGDVRMFFFRYDCAINNQVRISVRNGQAGFFTSQELKESSGVLWTAEEGEYTNSPRLDEALLQTKESFSQEEVLAYTSENITACFGEDFSWAKTHTRTPTISADKMNFLGEVLEFSPKGGPKERGYLKANKKIQPDDWLFDGHFKNDPCMPGTLMAEACLQAMAFYLTGLGYTLNKDGWRFEPVPEQKYKFICRGQVTPQSQELIYEIFVDEVIYEPYPTLYAHVLCTVDGVKAFLCERLGLQLVPDWPITSRPHLLKTEEKKIASYEGFPFDGNSIIHCAIGQPSKAFGPRFNHYDHRRSPRLPGPPYLFISRITGINAQMHQSKKESSVEVVYDIPEDAWYFEEAPTMPYAVLLEVALQPCGWLACFTLSKENALKELLFRNLDGVATEHREIVATDKTIVTKATLVSYAQLGDTIIFKFEVKCFVGATLVYETQTVFGFFSPSAFENQKGFPPEERHLLDKESNFSVDLTSRPVKYFGQNPSLPSGMLLMLDEISGYWPRAGKNGKGILRARKQVKREDWFLKAHFFQDPVQPGSLGLEAIIQVLQFYLIDKHGEQNGVFTPIALGSKIEWHYRGQINPGNQEVTILVEIQEDEKTSVVASASTWVDGTKIYNIPRIGVEIRSLTEKTLSEKKWEIDLKNHPWIKDHCPTFTIPALPITAELNMMAEVASSFFSHQKLVRAEMDAYSWAKFSENRLEGRYRFSKRDKLDQLENSGQLEKSGQLENALGVELQVYRDQEYQTIAKAKFGFQSKWASAPPLVIQALKEGVLQQSPYLTGELFHGASFQLMQNWILGKNGASCEVDVESKGVPLGLLHPGLLDAALHCIPFDRLQLWSEDIDISLAGYPISIRNLELFQSWPKSGLVRVEARFLEMLSQSFPLVQVWILDQDQCLATFQIKVVLMEKGKLGDQDSRHRKEFLLNQRFISGVSLSELKETESKLFPKEIEHCNWLPGTVNHIYNVSGETKDLGKHIVVAEHASQYLNLHPRYVALDNEGHCLNLPLNKLIIKGKSHSDYFTAHSEVAGEIDWQKIRDYWVAETGTHGFVHDLVGGLLNSFVRRVIISDPLEFQNLAQRPVLYLANHQTMVESLLFLAVASALTKTTAKAIAKDEHRYSWVGAFARVASSTMEKPPLGMIFFKREQQKDILGILQKFKEETSLSTSLLVHVEGKRSLHCSAETKRISSVFTDLALQLGWPIVPVKFVGGLPVSGDEFCDFPLNYGKQDYHIGKAIFPEKLKNYSYKDRPEAILRAMNSLGPLQELETPIKREGNFFSAEIPEKHTLLSKILIQSLLSLSEMSEQTDKVLAYLLGDSKLEREIDLEIRELFSLE